MATSSPTENHHPALKSRIDHLVEFAEPLHEETTVTPLMPVVARIMNLKESGERLSQKEIDDIQRIEREVADCERVLEELSYDYVQRLIAKPEPSKVFKILAEAGKFERELSKMVGKAIDIDGEKHQLTPEIVAALTKFRFSLGTPPITPKGIQTIEQIMFAGTLGNIYAFRDLMGGNKRVFDRFVAATDQMVRQSTHYTTSAERKAFEKESSGFANFDGVKGFTKSVVTGTVDSAERLITEQLLKNHKDKPINNLHTKLDDDLIRAMRQDKDSLFIVRAKSVEHDAFSSDVLKPEWRGIIGRLIIINDSDNARRAGCTVVCSVLACVTDAVDKFHVKDSGTPANTQMNLLSMLESFRSSDLAELESEVSAQIANLEAEGVHKQSAEEVKHKEWLITQQRDYLNLQSFLEFLKFISKIKNGDASELTDLATELQAETAEQAMGYFFKKLRGKGYQALPVPQGGGRRELGLIGKYHLHKFQEDVDQFRGEGSLGEVQARLKQLKERIGDDATEGIGRSQQQKRSSLSSIRNAQGAPGRLRQKIGARLREAIHHGSGRVADRAEMVREILDEVAAFNPGGKARAGVAALLKKAGVGSASKSLEREPFASADDILRTGMGKAHRALSSIIDLAGSGAETLQRGLEPESLRLAEKILHDIEGNRMQPSLALSDVGWTFNDVLNEDDFPPKNYLTIEMGPDGQLDPKSLEAKLEDTRNQLIFFPELFKLYCQSLILVVNDPHNPTSVVATDKVKLGILDIASRYGLTILADAAYHKQVASKTKTKQGDDSLAVFYEKNKSRFPNAVVIHTALPTTKWAMGAGRRTGVIVTNDTENGFADFVEDSIDGANLMSLYMDRESFKVGKVVKEVCKKLEPASWGVRKPEKIIDDLLASMSREISQGGLVAPVYFALMDARNELDRMTIRASSKAEIAQFVSGLIKDLKDLRLDKQTQRDSAERAAAAEAAIDRLSQKYQGLSEKCIKPEGPFYFCVRLDESGQDQSLSSFLSALARGRNIDVVPTAKGYVRFAFGGMTDGTPAGYNLLSIAIEVDLEILLQYWDKFKDRRKALQTQTPPDHNPEQTALKELFPGGEADMAATYKEKGTLIEAISNYKGSRQRALTYQRPASAAQYISSIQPDSPAHIVTITALECKNTKEFLKSPAFKDLFNHYLIEVKDKVPFLQGKDDSEVIALFGARQFAKKFNPPRSFSDGEKGQYAAVLLAVSEVWFSDNTIQIFASDQGADALLGAEKRLSSYLSEFLKAFLSPEQEQGLNIRPTFQAAYQRYEGVEMHPGAPAWLRKMGGKTEFAGTTVPANESPNMVTSGKARVAGVDRGIFRRDGDGEDAPKSEYFSSRLEKFAEVMDPKEYVCKMVQVGGSKVMLVMNRAYSHYIVEELRLFPQFELSDAVDMKPDAVSFLGIPSKVMGEDYRIGYFMDQMSDGTSLPVSWVDKEDITDYMGYLKKPILTVANEKVKEKGMVPIHGSAFTVVFKNGLRKTIVMGGDSGTGKSETIIAMVEQIMKAEGLADQVEAVELLAGDMLALIEKEDGQLYLTGTESGDFMRTTDISDHYMDMWRDLIDTGSKTNLDDAKNPRITIKGICDPEINLRPVRVNMFFNINNFQTPPVSGSVSEVEQPHNLIMQDYMNGYRGEKGTSGDQPNYYASILHSTQPDKAALLRKHQKNLDRLLGWDVVLDERMKPANAIVQFNDIEGEVFAADQMVKDLFEGKRIDDYSNGQSVDVIKTTRKGKLYYATLRYENGHTTEVPLEREGIFAKLYNPIASTLAGQPFVDPEGMDEVFENLARVMTQAGVITGNIFTQLKVDGMEYQGPAEAAQALLEFIMSDPRINDRFGGQSKVVNAHLVEKYGSAMISQGSIPRDVIAHNLILYVDQQSGANRAVDINKPGLPASERTIDLETPYYSCDSTAAQTPFSPKLITPEIFEAINDITTDPGSGDINTEGVDVNNLTSYSSIKAWDSVEELIYQVLVVKGTMQLGYQAGDVIRQKKAVIVAEKIAQAIIVSRGQ
jgi:hypothetical protein